MVVVWITADDDVLRLAESHVVHSGRSALRCCSLGVPIYGRMMVAWVFLGIFGLQSRE